MVVSDTVSFIVLLGVTIVFTSFSFAKDGAWGILLKFVSGLFWMIFGISVFYFMGPTSFLMILSLPFVIIGFLFIGMMFKDILTVRTNKRREAFNFDD